MSKASLDHCGTFEMVEGVWFLSASFLGGAFESALF
jgi:hypothetical protein